MSTEIFDQYQDLYKQMHNSGNFSGGSLKYEYVGDIKTLVQHTKSITVLDYGCGKAKHYKNENPINEQFGIKKENMSFYDIGVNEYSVLPNGDFDGVICTDVLEHVPEVLVDSVLETIFSKVKKFTFFVISCGLAVKILPNGENAHVTVKSPDWWNDKFKKYYDQGIIIHIKYHIPKDPKQNILNL